MKYKINAYLAVLTVAVVGGAAALIIVHAAFATTFNVVLVDGSTNYSYMLQ